MITCMRFCLLYILFTHCTRVNAQEKWYDSSWEITFTQIRSLEPDHIIGKSHTGMQGYHINSTILFDSTGQFREELIRRPLENRYTKGYWTIHEKDKLRLHVAGSVTDYKVFLVEEFYFYVRTDLESKFVSNIRKIYISSSATRTRRMNNKKRFIRFLLSNRNMIDTYFHRRTFIPVYKDLI